MVYALLFGQCSLCPGPPAQQTSPNARKWSVLPMSVSSTRSCDVRSSFLCAFAPSWPGALLRASPTPPYFNVLARVQVRRQYANTPLHPAPPPTLSRPSSPGTAPPNRRHKRPPLDDSSSSPRAFTELGRSQPCSSMMTTASISSC